jgi:predicted TIM-barrel fold metal-dependent hydrolase
MQSMQLYGHPAYLPVWRAAAEHGLPVAFHPDAETGVELAPTPAGYLRHFLGFAAYQPITFISHLTSMMVGGVLDSLPELRLVFADGGYDVCAPLLWRLDKDYRPMRGDMPWMKHPPSHYLATQVRFVAQRMEGPEDAAILPEWLDMTAGESTLMYGSNYPQWDFFQPPAAFDAAPARGRDRILAANAAELYGLERVGAPR